MYSPSPTQAPPTRPPVVISETKPEEQKVVESRPVKSTRRKRPGEMPLALFVKAIFRPIFKLLYYLIQFIKGHKLLTLVALLLLVASISATSFLTTGAFPFGIGSDPFKFQTHGPASGSSSKVKNWLYALRDGNVTALNLLDSSMSQPPNASQLVSQYSQSQAHITWQAINVIQSQQESDTTIDSFVEIDISSDGPGGPTNGFLIWHFVTISNQGQEVLLEANLVDTRAPL